MENVNIYGVLTNRCTICPCLVSAMGKLPKPALSYRNHFRYKCLYQQADYDTLTADGMKIVDNSLWYLTNISPPSLVRPDLLHCIYLGMLTHLMDWILPFLEDIHRLTTFDDIWGNVPPYPSFTHPKKAYCQVTQWNGKEMRNLEQIILVVFAAAIRRTADCDKLSPGQLQNANKAIRAVRYLSDFHLVAQYRSHTPVTI